MKRIWYLSRSEIISQKSIREKKKTEAIPEFQRLTKPNKHENETNRLSTNEKRSKADLKYLLISISYHEGKRAIAKQLKGKKTDSRLTI